MRGRICFILEYILFNDILKIKFWRKIIKNTVIIKYWLLRNNIGITKINGDIRRTKGWVLDIQIFSFSCRNGNIDFIFDLESNI